MNKKLPEFSELPLESFSDKTIFLDVDGTLVADHTPISKTIADNVRLLSQHNTVVLASNGSEDRTKIMADELGVAYIATSKPRIDNARSFVTGDVVVIGDKYLTDGLFARSLPAQFIHVQHATGTNDSLATQCVYLLDDIVSVCAPYVEAMRPWQWIKNLLVFAPLLFAVNLFDLSAFERVVSACAAFCIISSAMYIFNDIMDRDEDRLHPKKQYRPLACGGLSVQHASLLIVLLVFLEAYLLYLVPAIMPIIIGYVLLNLLYSMWLKRVGVVDIFIVAIFYLLRIIAGGLSAQVFLSPWIILCVLFGSLFVIIGKRRAEFAHTSRRAVLDAYSAVSLDYMLAAAAGLAVMSYGVYSVVGHDSPYLVYSTLFVAFVLFRMMNRIYTHPAHAETPEILVFTDPWIFAGFCLWAMYVFLIFY